MQVLAADADQDGKAEVYAYAEYSDTLYIFEDPITSTQSTVHTLPGELLLPFFAS